MTADDVVVLDGGRGGSAGVAVGDAVWLSDSGAEGAPRESAPRDAVAAFEEAREVVADALETEADAADGDAAAILSVHREFLFDPAFEDAVADAVFDGASANEAVRRATDDFVDRFEARGGRTAERADDLRDLERRLLDALAGDPASWRAPAVAPGSVVLADVLTPSRVVRLDLDAVAGVATIRGGVTAHATLVAQDAGVPVVVGVGSALRDVGSGERVRVDGTAGTVTVGDGVHSSGLRGSAGVRESDAIPQGPVAVDGRTVDVLANVGTTAGVESARERGAGGIGLFRTELDAIDRGRLPDEETQVETYRAALEAFPDQPVYVRTYDFGGDKRHPDASGEPGAFGERGIRRALAGDREAFETQLRALCRAAATPESRTLVVLLPFVTRVAEVDAAADLLDEAVRSLADAGVPAERPALGVVVETPAAVALAPELAARADVLSLGTNDLTQYVHAVDRADGAAGGGEDGLSVPLRRCVERVVDAAGDAGVTVSCCGALASDPATAAELAALGVGSLSVAPRAIPEVERALADGGGGR